MKSGKISSVILWSVISAAFIGPGTITTAFTAGAQFQIELLWAVVFSALACIVLQEVSARITIATGFSLGQNLSHKYGAQKGTRIQCLVALPVLLGCAAYEAGNILGAVSGLNLLFVGDGRLYTLGITGVAGFVLWHGGSRTISIIMTVLVGLMGISFLFLAIQAEFSVQQVIRSALVPVIPDGSEWIVLALIGTTIVPYNIFIGSAISKGSTVPLMRLGLSISVMIGGLITAWIMVAGSVTGEFTSFQELSIKLNNSMGLAGSWALGIGLFAAGFSSAITAPYAVSLIASTVLVSSNKKVIRSVWISVLLIGFGFGISGVKPIPVILAVQALNGFVLPVLTYFLILLIHDRQLIPSAYRHSIGYDMILLIILGTTLLLGLNQVDKAISSGFAVPTHFTWVLIVSIALVMVAGWQLHNQKVRHV